MRTKIALLILVVGVIIFSCDEPQPLGDSTFSYNPFTFSRDTLENTTSIRVARSTIDWSNHLRAWVGETKDYKSGISIGFDLPDTSLDLSTADSIHLLVRHSISFPENGYDTLLNQNAAFGFYETTDQVIDMSTSSYGTLLGVDSFNVKTNNLYWSYELPPGTISPSDEAIELGVFPEETGFLSAVYGGGSTTRPSLLFYFHEPDSAGNDSVTAITMFADTLHMHLEEQPAAFDRSKYAYLSQLSDDSLILELDMSELLAQGDTLTHVVSANLKLGVVQNASSYYISGSEDSLTTYYLQALDYNAQLYSSMTLIEDGAIFNNISNIIQYAVNNGHESVELVLKSNHRGYDPGIMALDTSLSATELLLHTSQVVRP